MENTKKHDKCFVIQEFDGSTFDKRFDETIKPAIEKCGLKALRADKILGLQPIIQKIEDSIGEADFCLADVSTNNPNVWLELGYALAMNKPCVIICDKSKRDKLPFDISHRPVILYKSDSKSGYEDLEKGIVESITNVLKTGVRSPKFVTASEGELHDNLKNYEIEIIGFLISKWGGKSKGCTHWEIKAHLENAGYNELSVGLGLSSLSKVSLIEQKVVEIETGNFDEMSEEEAHVLTQKGLEWIEQNRAIFSTNAMKKEELKLEDYDSESDPF